MRDAGADPRFGDSNVLLDGFMRWVVIGPAFYLLARPTIRGREHIPPVGSPAIIASNHLSFSDSMVIPLASGRRVSFLGKAEYFQGTGLKGAFMRSWFRSFGTIPVERDDARAAAESLHIAERVLAAGGAFGIYPEGTRSRDGRLHRGRTGVARLALASGAPIIPCALTGTDKLQPPDSTMPRRARITVEFGPAIDVETLREAYAKAALLRAITDAVTDAIGTMSAQQRSGRYASDVNAELDAAERHPRSAQPGTDQPGTDQPGTDQPGTDQPGSDQPGADEPGTDQPGADEPGTDQPRADEPGAPR